MIKKIIEVKDDKGICFETSEKIQIKRGRYIYNKTSHPLYIKNEALFYKVYSLEFKNQNVYWFPIFGVDDRNSGFHISLNFWENQKFLFLQRKHWLQKEENLRYIVNILFLVGGFILGILNFIKK
jgi:hypothetical protein